MTTTPLIPFFQLSDWELLPRDFFGGGFPPVPLSVKPFGTLVAIGVYAGAYLSVRQGRRLGVDERSLVSFMFWMILTAFVGGHVFDALFYYPELVAERPWFVLELWATQSSFGGFIGALLGALFWRLRYKVSIVPYADVVASSFPVGWVFGRMGCSLAHDHPGMLSDSLIAVRYPEGARFDLGLYEMLLTIPLAVAFLILRRRPRPWGFFLGTLCIAYAPTRFALDFLRARDLAISDARYGPFTPAQWGCFALLAAGVWVFRNAMRQAGTPESVRPPAPPRLLSQKTKS